MTKENKSLIDELNKMIGQPNVLLIDDNVRNLSAFKSQLRRDANVFLAENKAEALFVVNNNKIDFVFCDYRIPIYNGADILKEIVEIYPTIKRFVMTAYYTPAMKLEFLHKSNTSDFIQKPYDISDIIRKIN